MSRNRVFIRNFIFLFIAGNLQISFTNSVQASNCAFVGRVLESSNKRFKVGSGLCEGQSFALSTPIRIICTYNSETEPRVLWIRNGKELDKCKDREVSRQCTATEYLCDRLRSPDAKALNLFPTSPLVLELPHKLEWTPIPEATRYDIWLFGKTEYSMSTTQTIIKLPPITVEDSLQVVVEAYNSSTKIGSVSKTYNLIDPIEANRIRQDLRVISAFPVSENEKEKLRSAFLRASGLSEDEANSSPRPE